jgi:hypothetical protein
MFTMLNVGESHMGKTRAISTLLGRTVLFNFEPPDNVSSLIVPYAEMKRLTDYWSLAKPIEGILVVQYGLISPKLTLGAKAAPTKDRMQAFIEDVLSMEKHLGEFDNIAVETLAPMTEAALDFIVASNGRTETQIQDYGVAFDKVEAIIGTLMSFGKNVIATAHLESMKDEKTGRVRTLPLVIGKKLGPKMPKLFSEIFASEVTGTADKPKYVWNTKPEPGGFLTFLGSRKDKYSKLPKFIEPDYGYLTKLLKEVS